MIKDSGEITPFWNLIPQFFLMPLKGAGIVALLLFSSLATYVTNFFILVIILFVIVKYSTEILKTTAEGSFKAPGLTAKVLNDNYGLPFKQFVLLLLPIIAFSLVDSFIEFVIVLNIVIVYTFLLPATVMTLSYTSSLVAAINPFTLISLVSRIGWSYAILYVFLLLLNGGASTAYYFVVGDGPNASVFLSVLFQVYFIWVMYSMMGYVLYQHHEDIGYELPSNQASVDSEPDLLANFNSLVEEENFTAAQEELKGLILSDPENIDLRRKFHKIVKMSGDDKQLVLHGVGHIGRLLAARHYVEAVKTYLDCLDIDPDFKPSSESHYLPLAEEMRRMRLFSQAVELSNGFHVRFPDSANTPKLYMLIAKIFIEDLSQDSKAKPILQFLKDKYHGHAIEQEVEQYSQFLASVKA